MLPSYSRSHVKEKVERDYGNGAYPAGRAFSIQPHKFQPRSQPALRKRRQLIYRLAMAASLLLTAVFFFVPSARPSFFSPAGLGTFSLTPHLHLETVRYYDLANVEGSAMGWEREERILLCAPLRDASPHLPMFFSHLQNLTYPHNLIDLAFLVGDSKDNTLQLLHDSLTALQEVADPKLAFGEISVIEKDFGQKVNQDVESRHGFAAQASRRKSMAQARNWLLSAALRPTHSWVYWRDVDVETAPFTILEDLMRHNKDVIVPNVWRPLPDWLGGEQPYDLNSWQESETALALADTLDEDAVIVEGYAEYATWRPHLAYLRDPYGDPDMEMEIDGVGGVSILAKAKVFRSGVHFPAFSFEKHAETEGFGKMAKRMKYSVIGLPHYTIWHLYEPSVDDIRHMEEMEKERKDREKEEEAKRIQQEKISSTFDDSAKEWEQTKDILKAEAAEEASKRKAANVAKAQLLDNDDDDDDDDVGSTVKKAPAPKPIANRDAAPAKKAPVKKAVVDNDDDDDDDDDDVPPVKKAAPKRPIAVDDEKRVAKGKIVAADDDEEVAAVAAAAKKAAAKDAIDIEEAEAIASSSKKKAVVDEDDDTLVDSKKALKAGKKAVLDDDDEDVAPAKKASAKKAVKDDI